MLRCADTILGCLHMQQIIFSLVPTERNHMNIMVSRDMVAGSGFMRNRILLSYWDPVELYSVAHAF